jgi:flagellar biosynthetic protein FlhB
MAEQNREQDPSQKTEDPTQKRLEDARRKGEVVKTQDLPVWFLLLAAAGLMAGAEPLSRLLSEPLIRLLDHPHAFRLTGGGAEALLAELVRALAVPLTGIFATLFVGALAGHLAQHRPLWTTEKMKPDLDKISPARGLARMFGPQGWMNLLKGALKLAAVGAAAAYAVWPLRDLLFAAGGLEPAGLLRLASDMASRLLLAALVAVGAIAALDYVWQRQSFMARLRMSRQDIREEMKESEGDPELRARLRAIRQERSRRRMLAAVPKATVVIANPTHYSVALRYRPEEDAAPFCLAKGVDDLALRIREAAEAAGVAVIENPPLARALHASAEIDRAIPREHYEAVAKVIGFVMNAARRSGR